MPKSWKTTKLGSECYQVLILYSKIIPVLRQDLLG
ncbi:hypothetical protein NTHI1209_02083 [Haemophilus influenzae]|uniref:Uncharacterized protein n=1 Tax=Haemophilus influenzae TaxID=727 RepID=A0A158SZY9_HAEIF|nr:hypothetical protein NTHI1209_02083 [Haemophilus influenzae]